MKNAALAVTIDEFRKEYTKEKFTKACHDFVDKDCVLPVGELNDVSWEDCYDFLLKNLPVEEEYQKFHLVFEFLMPESQRRVDVVILSEKKVLSLEFKKKVKICNACLLHMGDRNHKT